MDLQVVSSPEYEKVVLGMLVDVCNITSELYCVVRTKTFLPPYALTVLPFDKMALAFI
jgi:hypothetical protein